MSASDFDHFSTEKCFPLQCLELMKPQEHLVVHFGDFVFTQKQLLYPGGTLERVRFDAGYLISAQIQLCQIWQPTEQSIRLDAIKLVIVEQAGEEMLRRKVSENLHLRRNIPPTSMPNRNSHLQFRGVERNVTRDFFQPSPGTVNRRPIAMTGGRALLVHAAFARVLDLAVIIRAWVCENSEVKKKKGVINLFSRARISGVRNQHRKSLHLNFSSFKASIRRRCIRFGASHLAPLVSIGFWCR